MGPDEPRRRRHPLSDDRQRGVDSIHRSVHQRSPPRRRRTEHVPGRLACRQGRRGDHLLALLDAATGSDGIRERPRRHRPFNSQRSFHREQRDVPHDRTIDARQRRRPLRGHRRLPDEPGRQLLRLPAIRVGHRRRWPIRVRRSYRDVHPPRRSRDLPPDRACLDGQHFAYR